MTRIALHGGGRMAQAVLRASIDQAGVNVSEVISPRPPGWDHSIDWYASLERLDRLPDVLIDFSLPDGTTEAALWCQSSGVALLSGVTGLHEAAQDALRQAANNVPVLWSPNMSMGVNLLARLCAEVARHAPPDRPVVIEDVHHEGKLDAPSGTALMLGASIERERPDGASDISYRSQRTGDVAGDHEVTFEWPGEKLVLRHEAGNRDIFARGSLAAASWLQGQAPGYYTAADWIGST